MPTSTAYSNNIKKIIAANPVLFVIIVTAPIVLAAIIQILPTFDDWNTLSSPNYDEEWLKYFLPFGTVWRPGDALLGYINAIDYKLFPLINHILVFAGHLASTLLVYKIAKTVGFGKLSTNLSTLFFYISPCVCGTIYSCDALNQTYSHLWGMAAVYSYIIYEKKKKKYILWTLFVALATLSKDNGIAWSVVPPIVAFAFGREKKESLKYSLLAGCGIAIVYAAIRLALPCTELHNGSHIEQMMSIFSKAKGIATWIGYTWFAADYIYIMHEPSRSIPMFVTTFLLSAPFVLYCFFSNIKNLTSKTAMLLVAAMFVTASPNLIISMSIMNAYCTLGLAALLLGYLIDSNTYKHLTIMILAILYTCTALFTDVHHWYKSWQTALPGKHIAKEIIEKTGKPVDKAYCILINNEKKYSSFCVPTDETVGWGIAMMHETGYVWPKEIKDTTLAATEAIPESIDNITAKAMESGYECVWIVYPDSTKVIRKQ